MKKCYIYTRVSTSTQIDGYSLDAQREKMRRYADFQEMKVIREYSDEGKSGKNIVDRPQFQQMIMDIESEKDNVDYVLVFKLSRFGRNAADTLSSLQRMQDFGVNLICVEESIDSSKDSGKLMISVLSAVAEIERENILVQTMAGRNQKAMEGRWNGGFGPLGYQLVNGELQVDQGEAEIIKIIFDKYVNHNMSPSAIAMHLNTYGYKKRRKPQNGSELFSAAYIRVILDNPVYAGKIAFGRRKTEKIKGERNRYHIVKQKDYPVYDGIHEAIISEELWNRAQEKRKENKKSWVKMYNDGHEHIFSGLLRCPVCGAPLYGNVNAKKRKDGTPYERTYYYQCKNRKEENGHKCGWRKQLNQTKTNAAIEEI